jgi:hypothetical protein
MAGNSFLREREVQLGGLNAVDLMRLTTIQDDLRECAGATTYLDPAQNFGRF